MARTVLPMAGREQMMATANLCKPICSKRCQDICKDEEELIPGLQRRQPEELFPCEGVPFEEQESDYFID